MRSLRRGITSATAGDLRKIPRNLLGQHSNPLASWCPSLQPTSTNFVRNLGASPKCRNYLKLIEDPELPKLISLYKRVCRDCHGIPVGSTKLKRSELDDPPRKHWNKRYFPKYTIDSGKISNDSVGSKGSELDGPPRRYRNKGEPPKYTKYLGNLPVGSFKLKRTELDDSPRKSWNETGYSKYTKYLGNLPVGSIKLKKSELDEPTRKSGNEADSPKYPIDIGGSPSTKRSTITLKSERSHVNSKESITLEVDSPPNKSDKKSTSHKSTSNRKNGSSVKSRTPIKWNKNSLEGTHLSNASLYKKPNSKSQGKSKKSNLEKFLNTKASANDQTESTSRTKRKKKYNKTPKIPRPSLVSQTSKRRSTLRHSQMPMVPLNEAKSLDSVEAFLENFKASRMRNSLKMDLLRKSLSEPSKIDEPPNTSNPDARSISSSLHLLRNYLVNPYKIDSKSTKSSSLFFKNSLLNRYKIDAKSVRSSSVLKSARSTLSRKGVDNILSSTDFIRKYRWSPFNMREKKSKLIPKRYGLKPFKIGARHLKSSRNNPFKVGEKNMNASSRFLKHFRFKSASDDEEDDNSIKYPDDNSERGVSFRRDSSQFRDVSQADNLSSLSWLPKTDIINANPGPIDHIHFGPIDIEAHKKDFFSFYNIKPDVKRGWSRIPWPKSFEPRRANAQADDVQSALKKETPFTKKQLGTAAAACKKKVVFRNFSKFHCFRFEVCRIKRRRPRKAVSCQTEVNRNRCELCDFCRPSSQPDEPFMIEMKRRQDREVLKQYYLKMIKGNKEFCAERVSGEELGMKPSVTMSSVMKPEEKSSSKSHLGKMRHQLEQCLVMLSLCGRLIEDRLQLSRMEKDI
ncbi:uncharacterized protein LOC108023131 [Drosophila biarmipes]|uniref:uncharacterized protein LOC108023131 n=1 Tax=Drosophila biarmipes TaxID=125945 RepID=UPI0007E6FC7E|nr:uncharacterized protein LOC108023131 [Drosophila biarmipes]